MSFGLLPSNRDYEIPLSRVVKRLAERLALHTFDPGKRCLIQKIRAPRVNEMPLFEFNFSDLTEQVRQPVAVLRELQRLYPP